MILDIKKCYLEECRTSEIRILEVFLTIQDVSYFKTEYVLFFLSGINHFNGY